MALFDKINCNSANMCLKIKTQVPLESTFGPKKEPKNIVLKILWKFIMTPTLDYLKIKNDLK